MPGVRIKAPPGAETSVQCGHQPATMIHSFGHSGLKGAPVRHLNTNFEDLLAFEPDLAGIQATLDVQIEFRDHQF